MIVEAFRIDATNADVLASPSRLNAIPYNGNLIIEMQSQNNDATNFMSLTVQLPNGDTPLDGVRIPAGAVDTSLNSEDKYQVSFFVTQGGHVTIALTETGSAVIDMRVTLMP